MDSLVEAKWQDALQQLSSKPNSGTDGLLSFVQAWDIAVSVLRPRALEEPTPTPVMAQAAAAFELVHSAKMTQSLIDHFVKDLTNSKYYLEDEVRIGMARYESSNDVKEVTKLINRLSDWYKHWYPNPQSSTLLKAYRMTFHTLLSASLTPSFRQALAALLAHSVSESQEVNATVFHQLELLGLLDRHESLLSGVIYNQIELKIDEMCPKQWYTPLLTTLRTWLRDSVVPWLAAPYARGAKNADDARVMVSGIVSRFDFYVCKVLCDLRIKEIFDIIVDYPDSTDALNDLKECLTRVDRRSELVKAIRKANNKRLLHPGADTKDILHQYVNTIKCLRIVDPPGVLLFKVANPIRQYLRDRPDTIRSILSSLVGEGEDLVDENEQIVPLQTVAEDYSDRNWEPEPIDAGPEFRAHKPSDVISILVSIYDSKDLFVKELQSLLAQRLLAIRGGNFEKERRNIEILKLRFGDAALQVCEVMLKDMTDSRRLDQHIQSQEVSVLHPTVISQHFWPPLQTSKLRMPDPLQRILDKYSLHFNAFKPDKRLRWMSHLGELELDIELQDRTISVEASPYQAAVIELFSEKDTWTFQELVSMLGPLDEGFLRKALLFWLDHGVLEEGSNKSYRLLEVASPSKEAPHQNTQHHSVIEDFQPVISSQQQQSDQMRIHWQYIKGMLTNVGPLPIERIQGMLRFAPGYDRTLDQLAGFLEAAKREGLIIQQDSVWKLNS